MALVKKSQPKETPCIVCGKSAVQSICPTCEARIQGEAIEKKTGIEKKGRTESGRQ
jgi:predicted amidophosphoribosyltransferase